METKYKILIGIAAFIGLVMIGFAIHRSGKPSDKKPQQEAGGQAAGQAKPTTVEENPDLVTDFVHAAEDTVNAASAANPGGGTA